MIEEAVLQRDGDFPVMKGHSGQHRRDPQITDPLGQHGSGNLHIRRTDITFKPAYIFAACSFFVQLAKGNCTNVAFRRFTYPQTVFLRHLLPGGRRQIVVHFNAIPTALPRFDLQ
ncbi:hypothetical protein D3C76_1494350 [compost metagenome]